MSVKIFISGDPEKFRNYARAVETAGGTPCFSGSPEDCQGLLLPGGGDIEPWRYGQENTHSRGLEPQRDETELALLERFIALGRPVLGVCRGAQVINFYFCGTLIQDMEGHRVIPGGDVLHTAEMAPGLLRRLWGPRALVNSFHHQAANRIGEGLRVLARAEDGTVDALGHVRHPVLAIQWHPERMPLPPVPQAADGLRVYRAFLAAAAEGAPFSAGDDAGKG